MGGDPLGDRRQPPRGAADPVAQRRALDIDAVAGQDARLAIERQAVNVFAHDDIGDERRARATLLDR